MTDHQAPQPPETQQTERRDIPSLIRRAKKESGAYKAYHIITMIVDCLVAIACVSLFGMFCFFKFSALGKVDFSTLFVQTDWLGILLSAAAIPILIFIVYSWWVSFPLVNILETVILGSYVKKHGYDLNETLEVLDNPSLLKRDLPKITDDMSNSERHTVQKLTFKANKDAEEVVEKASILLPYLENTSGKGSGVLHLIVKLIVAIFTSVCVWLSFALAAPLGGLLNSWIQKGMPDIHFLGSIIVFVVLWLIIAFAVLPICNLIEKIPQKSQKKAREQWWQMAIDRMEK